MKKNNDWNGICESLPEFDQHNSVIYVYDKKTSLRGYIAFHRKGFKIPSFGATRFLKYKDDIDALKDALRLSKLMSYKNALAGLPYGGAKAVLIEPANGKYKKSVLLDEYAKHLERLKGAFITGTDMGLDLEDLKLMKQKTKNLVGLVNNPEKATAQGLFYSLLVVAKHLYSKKTLKDLSFAIQGVGKVGEELLSLVYPFASKIYVSEINIKTLKKVKAKYPNIVTVDFKRIHSQKVDIFCPCAIPNILNSKTVNQIKAKAIVGSANNQLRSTETGDTLHKFGILYCPDYVVNAGGLIAVADEYQNRKPGGLKLEEKVKSIGDRLDKILTLSKKKNKAPIHIANEMAQKIFAN